MTNSIVTQSLTIKATSSDLSLGKIAAALESVGIYPADITIVPLRRYTEEAEQSCQCASKRIP